MTRPEQRPEPLQQPYEFKLHCGDVASPRAVPVFHLHLSSLFGLRAQKEKGWGARKNRTSPLEIRSMKKPLLDVE